mmetsp:Transcript_4948/g.9270  ORF Transcript_4948/g.9270 Transcript_4948/m.9270 type:complete len:89 (-) Transcript_4948:35-301(-)
MALRVRNASANTDAFRHVRFPLQSSIGNDTNLEKLESLICKKFRVAHGSGVRSVSTLVRLRDRLEIADSMDVTLLEDGDELEAVFTDV